MEDYFLPQISEIVEAARRLAEYQSAKLTQAIYNLSDCPDVMSDRSDVMFDCSDVMFDHYYIESDHYYIESNCSDKI